MRTPDEERMDDIAKFFGVTIAYLRQDRRRLTLSGSPRDGESYQPPFGGEPDRDSSSLFNDLPQIGAVPQPQREAPPPTGAAPHSGNDTYWLLAKFFAGVSQNGILIRLAVQDMDHLADSIAQALVRNGIVFPPRR
jgi:hypothetical protein